MQKEKDNNLKIDVMPFLKTKSKWIINPNMKYKVVRLPKENIAKQYR